MPLANNLSASGLIVNASFLYSVLHFTYCNSCTSLCCIRVFRNAVLSMKIILKDFIDFIIPSVLVRYAATKLKALFWFNSIIQKFQLTFCDVLQFITTLPNKVLALRMCWMSAGQNEPLQDTVNPKLEDIVVLLHDVATDLTCLMCWILIKTNQCQAGLNFCMVSLSSLGH